MSELRNRLGVTNITAATMSQFQTHWEARTTEPLEDCLHSKYFGNVRMRLRCGDQISLVQFEDINWAKISMMVVVRVMEITDDGHVYCVVTTPIFSAAERLMETVEHVPHPVYVVRVFGKFGVKGLEHEGLYPEFPTRKDAMEWVSRQAPNIILTEAPQG